MARTRIKGKNLTFSFGTPAVAYECDLVSAVLSRGDAPNGGSQDGVVTFCDASTSAGGQVWTLEIEAVQSTDVTTTGATPTTESLHTKIWNAAAATGGEKLPFVFAPHGNATPSEAQPHYTGTAVVDQGGYPTIGGSAGGDSFTWTYTFLLDPDVVTRVTA